MTIDADRAIIIYCFTLLAITGAAFGSFLNCAAYRIARGESFLSGRSRCPGCGHALGVLDLFPIFSWLLLRGKCRYCGQKIPVRYFLTECFFAAVTVLTAIRFGLTPEALRNWVFFCCLFCLSLVDLETKTIPDGCLIIPAAAWLVFAVFTGMGLKTAAVHAFSAFLSGGAILLISLAMDAALGRESMGGGDVKLYALTGLYLGPIGTLFAVIFSCLLGLVVFAVRNARGSKDAEIPFGPSIAAAAAFMLLFGEGIVTWYGRLLGF
ncbi:MAG: prepilin peptidase [Lachnospiraceae bacterium]|nr:prepilin peptidase [Lachnospiraceae bacterium]